MTTSENLLASVVLTLNALCILPSFAGRMFIGKDRYAPTEWTKPKIMQHDGKVTVVPSLPKRFESVTEGVKFNPKNVSVSIRKTTRQSRMRTYKLKDNNGRVIEVHLGDTFEFNGKTVCLHKKSDKLVLKPAVKWENADWQSGKKKQKTQTAEINWKGDDD